MHGEWDVVIHESASCIKKLNKTQYPQWGTKQRMTVPLHRCLLSKISYSIHRRLHCRGGGGGGRERERACASMRGQQQINLLLAQTEYRCILSKISYSTYRRVLCRRVWGRRERERVCAQASVWGQQQIIALPAQTAQRARRCTKDMYRVASVCPLIESCRKASLDAVLETCTERTLYVQ
jgi:hypothetical protein